MYREGVGKRRLIGEHLVKTDAVRVKIFSNQSLDWQKETPAEKQVVEGNLGNALFPSLKYGRPSQNAHAVLGTSPPVSFVKAVWAWRRRPVKNEKGPAKAGPSPITTSRALSFSYLKGGEAAA